MKPKWFLTTKSAVNIQGNNNAIYTPHLYQVFQWLEIFRTRTRTKDVLESRMKGIVCFCGHRSVLSLFPTRPYPHLFIPLYGFLRPTLKLLTAWRWNLSWLKVSADDHTDGRWSHCCLKVPAPVHSVWCWWWWWWSWSWSWSRLS